MITKLLFKILLKPKLILWQVVDFILQVIVNGSSVSVPILASIALDNFFKVGHVENNEIIIIIALLLLNLVMPPISSWLNVYIGENISLELKNQLINKILRLSPDDLIKNDQGKIYTIFTNDVYVLKDTLINAVPAIITSIILLVGSIFFMYRLNANLAISIIIVIPLIASIVVIIYRQVIKYFRRQQEIRDKINKTIDENIKASMLVRVFVAENTEEKKFDTVNSSSYKLGLDIVKKISLVFPVLNITMFVGQLLVLSIGGLESIAGRLSIGEISAFNNYVIMFTMPFMLLSFMSNLIGQSFASVGRINSIFGIKEKKIVPLPAVENFESMEFKNFGFSLNNKLILHDINFQIKSGDNIGIIGMTGSGKTMFVESILKFIDNYTGEFLINDKSADSVDYNLFRSKIGYVSQKNFILSGTVYDNIDFYRNFDKEKIELAARTSLVTEFTDKYNEGLQHVIGERGEDLSGGQKQRLTIARALVGNPEILILDDSTSKLDMSTESKLLKNIKTNYPGLTIIIVAQKIASIKNCNRIYVMENGTFEISGDHNFLMQSSFLYQEIDLTQSNYHQE
jgi:ATP-binding cassette, subfamily B, bacterial